ncbi:MAG: YciI family protein [Planctomycetota bacterium]
MHMNPLYPSRCSRMGGGLFLGAILLTGFIATEGYSTPLRRLGSLLDRIRDQQEGFDPDMAKELHADERGMRMFVMAFLKSGPNRDQDKEVASQLQKAHMDNIGKLAREGKLILAGPFGDDGDIRGIYVFDTDSVEVAKSWTETDPAIQAGRLTMELHPWYGSSAMVLVNDLHRRLQPSASTEK